MLYSLRLDLFEGKLMQHAEEAKKGVTLIERICKLKKPGKAFDIY